MPGTVVEKRESVEELIDPYWRPVHEVVVAFEPASDEAVRVPWQPGRWAGGVSAPVATDLATYDRLRPGSAVQVRYFPPAPDIARLAEQSLAEVVFGPLLDELRESGLLLDVLLLGWFVLATKRRWWPGFFTTDPRKLGLLLLHLVFLQAWPLSMLGMRDLLPPPSGPLLQTTATVQEVRVIRSIGHARTDTSQRLLTLDLPRPFERALVRFVPAGWDQPVVAIDEVTPGSVPGLEQGARVSLTYAQAQPRVGWIDSASREHRRENRLFVHALFTVPFVLMLIVGQVLMLLLRLIGMSRRVRGA